MKTLLSEINSLNFSLQYMTYAAQLAADINKPLKFLYVFNPDMYPLGMPDTTGDQVQFTAENIEIISSSINERISANIEKIRRNISTELPISFNLEFGFSQNITENYIAQKNIDMTMVEGNAQENGSFLSDTNMKVIKRSSCPVWVIPTDMIYKPFTKIVYASDYNEEDISTLKKITDVASVYSADIIALHITDHNDFRERLNSRGFEKIINEKTGYDKISFRLINEKKENHFPNVLHDFIDSEKADLLVMLKENENFFEKIFTKSSVKEVINHLHIPMLVFHEKKQN